MNIGADVVITIPTSSQKSCQGSH